MHFLTDCREMARLRERHLTGFRTWDVAHCCSLQGLLQCPANEFKEINPTTFIELLKLVSQASCTFGSARLQDLFVK